MGNQAVFTPATPLDVSAGNHQITADYNGDTNFNTSTSPAFNLTVNPATTTTTVSASVNTFNLGGSTTYTVSVQGTPAAAGNPPGAVTITDGGLNIPCNVAQPIAVSASNPATATCIATYTGAAAPLLAGVHSVVATYISISTNIAGSTSSPITVTVNQDTMSIGPITTPSPITYNNGGTIPTLTIPYTLAGTVTPPPSLNFQVFDGATLLGTIPASTNPALFALGSVYQSVGTHTLKVTYPTGDPNYAPTSSTPITLVVDKAEYDGKRHRILHQSPIWYEYDLGRDRRFDSRWRLCSSFGHSYLQSRSGKSRHPAPWTAPEPATSLSRIPA